MYTEAPHKAQDLLSEGEYKPLGHGASLGVVSQPHQPHGHSKE